MDWRRECGDNGAIESDNRRRSSKESDMRRTTFVAVAVLSTLAFSAWATEGVELSLRSKALVSAGSIPEPSTPAAASKDAMPILPLMGEAETLSARSNACLGRQVCYDAGTGHVVVRPAREYMPQIGGMTPENVSVRRNRVSFTYSFK
jgi:hypothetical protein